MSDRRFTPWIASGAIVLLALNLRTFIGSLGVVLEPIRASFDLGPTAAGVLTTLPVVCFAVFGALTPTLVRSIGLSRTAFGLLVVLAIALVGRVLVQSGAAFIAITALALAAAGVGNVILPALTKEYLPDLLTTVSAAYGVALLGGAAIGSGLTVPIAEASGAQAGDAWRYGLGAWSLLALVAAVPWVFALRASPRARLERGASMRWTQVARSPLAWALGLTFGCQAAAAYAQFGWYATMLEDAGLSDRLAGAMLALLSVASLSVVFSLPRLIDWAGSRPILPVTFSALTVAGWCGMLIAPTSVPWLWSLMLGLGGGLFPWCLTMIGRRTRTPDTTAALSGFVQGLGYGIATLGPLGVAVLYDVTGTFKTPIAALAGLALVMGIAGTVASRGGSFEASLQRAR